MGTSPNSLVTGAYIDVDSIIANALTIYFRITLSYEAVVDPTPSCNGDGHSHFDEVLSANVYTSNLCAGKTLLHQAQVQR